jgi:hypothetical protein
VEQTNKSKVAQDPKADFVREQYVQYWEMKRVHLSFSWQIPAVTVVAVVAIIGLDADRISAWRGAPLVPALEFLALGLFLALMFLHHRRNLMFASLYDRALAVLEKEYGDEVRVHHFQVGRGYGWWNRLSSSLGLSVFLSLLSLSLLATSGYWFHVLWS